MRLRAGPPQERIHVAPVLAHAGVHGKEREDKVLVAEQAIGPVFNGFRDPRAESDEGLQASDSIDPHAEVDHDEVRILAEVDGATVDGCGHRKTPGKRVSRAASQRVSKSANERVSRSANERVSRSANERVSRLAE